MNRSRGRPRKFDPDTALHKAMLVFWQRGLSATSLDDLAFAMGMNRPSIYNAFGNKESLYRLALAQFCGQLDLGIEQALKVEPDLRKGLVKFYDQALDVYCGAKPALGCLMICTAPADAIAHPEVRNDLKALMARVDDQLARRITDAIRNGDFPASGDPKLVAKLIQGVLHSLAIRARAGESKSSLKKMTRYAVNCLPR